MFDHVLVDILNGDPFAHIVLQASRSVIQTKSLQHRIRKVLQERLCSNTSDECPALKKSYSRMHFLPRVTSDEVLDLMQKSSVVLHPFPVCAFEYHTGSSLRFVYSQRHPGNTLIPYSSLVEVKLHLMQSMLACPSSPTRNSI
jgi:hypothetical protein